MSVASSSIINSLRQIPTANTFEADHHIFLVDEERPAEEREEEEDNDAERSGSEAPPSQRTPRLPRNPSDLQQSLKRQWTKRKYAKYDRDRYELGEDPATTPPPPDEDPAIPAQIGEEAAPTQSNYLERSRAKAKSFLRRKGTLGQRRNEHDTVIDILYENQRGVFFFGIPKYSSASLLPNDPPAWQTATLRPSPVDIRNAQLPDPSWEWAWKSWYVDMSRDVDEEGWEYSFKFRGGFAWHGNHPWLSSFVRRRRWLRMRRRRDSRHHTTEKAHEFTAEYFTIHPSTVRSPSDNLSRAASSEMARLKERARDEDDELDLAQADISDIASLIHLMRKAAVDREKLAAVGKFVDTGGDELYYLSERMAEIMNLFVFQSSRRQLLTNLLQRFDAVHERRESLAQHEHDDDDAQAEHDAAAKQAENLMKAVRAADEQVKRLEFWSDIKGMAHAGDTLHDTAESTWDSSRWQGLSPTGGDGVDRESAFASKQDASEGAPELHRHPEHGPTGRTWAPGLRSGGGVVAVKHLAGKESSAGTDGGYVTAAESASELADEPSVRDKGKGRLSSLDGVEEGEEQAAKGSSKTTRSVRWTKQSVDAVEPVPEESDDRQPGGRGGGGDGS